MDDKELRKCNRQELLELLLQQGQEIEDLRERLRQAEEKLESRRLIQTQAGTMAQAALALQDIFARADAAASQYVENARRYCAEQQELYEREVNRARRQAAEILTKAESGRLLRIKQADRYWEEMLQKWAALEQEFPGLRERLAALSEKDGQKAEKSKE